MIYFILGALSYVLHWDALNNNPAIKFIGVLVIFWALTFAVQRDETNRQDLKNRFYIRYYDPGHRAVRPGDRLLYDRREESCAD